MVQSSLQDRFDSDQHSVHIVRRKIFDNRAAKAEIAAACCQTFPFHSGYMVPFTTPLVGIHSHYMPL